MRLDASVGGNEEHGRLRMHTTFDPELARIIENVWDLCSHSIDESLPIDVVAIFGIRYTDDIDPGFFARDPCDRTGLLLTAPSMGSPEPQHVSRTLGSRDRVAQPSAIDAAKAASDHGNQRFGDLLMRGI